MKQSRLLSVDDMIRFVEKPNLPQGKLRQLILGEKYKKVLQSALFDRNITPIWLKNNNSVDKRLEGHCDLMAVHLGGSKIAVQADRIDSCENINNVELIKIAAPLKPEYPYDAGLNICIVGDRLIYNPKSANPQIVSQINGARLCCKQGYTKCSICVVDENSIITADNKIAFIASAAGLNVLSVNEKLTALDGFEHGFIGGASFKINRNEMAFTGTINNSNERKRIESFLDNRGVQAVYLTDEPIFDIGSAIPIVEEI